MVGGAIIGFIFYRIFQWVFKPRPARSAPNTAWTRAIAAQKSKIVELKAKSDAAFAKHDACEAAEQARLQAYAAKVSGTEHEMLLPLSTVV